MNKKINVDTKQYPIIIITPIEEPSLKDIEIFTHEMVEILSLNEGNFVVISDNSQNVNLPVNVRVKLGKSLNYISGKFSTRELAVFLVINSAFGRIMFNCISLIARNNNLNIVASLGAAETQARTILEKAEKAKIL